MLDIIQADKTQAAADFSRVWALIQENDLSYKGVHVRSLAIPKLITAASYDEICRFIDALYKIFDRVIEQYFADADYRALFDFPAALEALILSADLAGSGGPPHIPMARIDFFLDEETGAIKMCEINTDGTSAMNEDRLLGEFLAESSAFQRFIKDRPHRRFELFDSWVREFLAAWRKKTGRTREDLPRVAIADFLNVGYVTEFEVFKTTFLRQGMECEICDIRELTYDGNTLRSKSGMAIDAIYRRAVTSDIMAAYDEIGPFIQAAKDGAVCLIGDFLTQIVHNKRFFYILYHPLTDDILTGEQRAFIRRHFPPTYPLTAQTLAEQPIFAQRADWIIKPCDSYGAKGFYAGKNETDERWIKLCEGHLAKDYIVQRFQTPYKSPNIDFLASEKVHKYANLTGIYCYNGRPYGVYSRLAGGEIISTQYDEKTVATVLLL